MKTQAELIDLLNNNPGKVFIKFGAQWCGPCRAMRPQLSHWQAQLPPFMPLVEIDVDDCPDIFMLFKSKRVVKNLPTLLVYNQGNTRIETPDGVVVGNDVKQIDSLFMNGFR